MDILADVTRYEDASGSGSSADGVLDPVGRAVNRLPVRLGGLRGGDQPSALASGRMDQGRQRGTYACVVPVLSACVEADEATDLPIAVRRR